MTAAFADRTDMQNRLFAELSRMFAQEVPMYDKSLLVNRICNRAVCDLLGALYPGFSISDEQLDRTSGERHGAIRIGKPDEYRWICRFFGAFAMEPHNYYDMSNVGTKSQPIVATAFRSVINPEHRVFCSLLMTDYFDPATRARIEALLAPRQVFSEHAQSLLERSGRDGGLTWDEAEELIGEGVNHIFKWTGAARDYRLYRELCDGGFKIAADIACFGSHHLNHLTPNTFCMDLYTAAMKRCMGEMDAATFQIRATRSLERLVDGADWYWMRLHFRHLSNDELDVLTAGRPDPSRATVSASGLATALAARLERPDCALHAMKHAGFKDHTEGPAWDTPVLLRQDAYKALSEPVRFQEPDGSVVEGVHTARFGEIEQRFYTTTLKGRALYDECLAEAERVKELDPGLHRRDFFAYEAAYAEAFARFPKVLPALRAQGLVYVRYSVTKAGEAAAASRSVETCDVEVLISAGYLRFEGLRHEDFLPVSAAGIFASNLSQYGTKSTAATKPVYTQSMLEEILGRRILDADAISHAQEAASLLDSFARLGVMEQLAAYRGGVLQAELEAAVAAIP